MWYFWTFMGGMIAGIILIFVIAAVVTSGQASWEEERMERELGGTL